jgi:hypothetical protein
MKMNKNIIILLLGFLMAFTACEKDGDKITMLEEVVAPTLSTPATLTLTRATSANVLEFVGTVVNPGFNASATYFLEACAAGNNFQDVVTVFTGNDPTSIKVTVANLNQLLLKKFEGDLTHNIDFRLRSVLTVDGGTGAAGTGDQLFEYISEKVAKQVAVYGLPRLDLNNSGRVQKIVSPAGDGKYVNYVKLDPAQPFTLTDPETSKTYGFSSEGVLVEGTAGIAVPTATGAGWYELQVDIAALTYTATPYMMGIAGSAAPNGWDGPNKKMDYNDSKGFWYTTITLTGGAGAFIKFRTNDSWNWNMGLADSGVAGELKQGGVGNDIPVAEAGTYYVTLTVITNDKGVYTMTKQ